MFKDGEFKPQDGTMEYLPPLTDLKQNITGFAKNQDGIFFEKIQRSFYFKFLEDKALLIIGLLVGVILFVLKKNSEKDSKIEQL